MPCNHNDALVPVYSYRRYNSKLISCIFNVFNVAMNNIVTSEGAAKTTMCALLIGAVLTIALDPIFIYVLDLGVAGAAIATAISQVVSTRLCIKSFLSWLSKYR